MHLLLLRALVWLFAILKDVVIEVLAERVLKLFRRKPKK